MRRMIELKRRAASWAAALCLVLGLAACGEGMKAPKTSGALSAQLEEFASWDRVAGFGVSVFSPEEVFYEGAFGLSDIEAGAEYTISSTQNVASVSKVFIAAALMRAEEMGALSIDDPVNKYLEFDVTNPHAPNSAITLRQLAMHTSGIKYSEKMTDELAFQHGDMPLGEFLRSYLSVDGEWYSPDNYHREAPGELGDYSNVGASLLALAIEEATDTPFDQFTRQQVFDPLGMENTYWYRPGRTLSDSTHYTILGKSQFSAASLTPDAMYPSGTLITSVPDLAKFVQMVMRNGEFEGVQVLSETSVDEMLHLQKLKSSLDDEIYRQGLLWYSAKDQLGVSRELIGHNGGHNSAFAMMFFDPKTKRGLIMLGNTNLDPDHNHVAYFNIFKTLWLFSRST